MRMTAVEKRFINSSEHTAGVARHGLELLALINVSAARRYLDVGCGVGTTACEVARRYGFDVLGIDVDPEQIERARANGGGLPVRFEVMDATRLPLSDAEFDIVASNMATHHIWRWDRALSEMIRMVRPGGYLIYGDFMFPGWLSALGRRLIPFFGMPSLKRIDAICANAGLMKVYQSGAAGKLDFIWLKEG